MTERVIELIAVPLFSRRRWILAAFVLLTVFLGLSASRLRVDAGFTKMIPLQHEYMKNFMRYKESFGGSNRVLVALVRRDGDIFTPEFFKTLKEASDEVFFIPGVERASITSLFTPNVRFIEVVEEGFVGGNVIPADFRGSPGDFAMVRKNILKSAVGSRLVSRDLRGTLIRADLLEIDPETGERLDYRAVAARLEAVRKRFQTEEVSVHIIGFAKAIGDIADGAKGVVAFFGLAFLITGFLLRVYTHSWRVTVLALVCAVVPVVWLLGLLPLIGYGIDPMSILVPFLIFAIGVSHAVQMTHVWQMEALKGSDSRAAARSAFDQLFIPGAVALATTALAFIVILHIRIEIVQELGVASSLGVLLMVVTNKFLLPVLLSYTPLSRTAAEKTRRQEDALDVVWRALSRLARRGSAKVVLAAAVVVLALGGWKGRQVRTGDLDRGLPELRESSRYNLDNAAIVDRFAIGVDVLSVFVQTTGAAGACTDYKVMDAIDRFEARMNDVPGVQSVLALTTLAKVVNGGWNEGSLKWRVLSRDPVVLAQSVTPIDTSSGLLNTDCSAMQVMIFTKDHKGETLARVVQAVKDFARENNDERMRFLLAGGNAGVMAATNETVDAAEITMLIAIYGVTALLCFLMFRSWRAVICIIIPLALVSILCNAVMAVLGIGLKVPTLPVIALGVGAGVDYGIYLFDRLQEKLSQGASVPEAFHEALQKRGAAAVFTSLTMSVGVACWTFSALKFQADMGALLAFMFLVNMFGAVLLLPALAAFVLKDGSSD